MKIILEIDTVRDKDVTDAISSLTGLIKKENLELKDEIVEVQEVPVKSEAPTLIVYPDFEAKKDNLKKETELLNLEILSLKEESFAIEEEKKSLVEENKKLLNKISELESIEKDTEIKVENDSVNEELKGKIDELNRKIDELEKNSTFHEGRSNKNFEEIKKLRVLIDNLNVEKRNLEKEKRELEELKALEVPVIDNKELEDLKLEIEDKSKQIESFEATKAGLRKEIEFHKNRSKDNWNEIKVLKENIEGLDKEKRELLEKIEDLESKMGNITNEDEIIRIKEDSMQAKAEFENIISELRLDRDKLQNEINILNNNYSENDIEELKSLRNIKEFICSNEKGFDFWKNVENQI